MTRILTLLALMVLAMPVWADEINGLQVDCRGLPHDKCIQELKEYIAQSETGKPNWSLAYFDSAGPNNNSAVMREKKEPSYEKCEIDRRHFKNPSAGACFDWSVTKMVGIGGDHIIIVPK